MDKRPLKVFLCHASTDKPKVRELYRYLRRRGINPWFDEEHLVGGQDWQVEIPKALATSDAIIICLTKNSVDKEGYIQKEIKFALDKALEMPEGRIFLIPVKFEECEVPFTLSRYQWVDLTIESGYAKMMRALKFRASQLERSTVEVSKKDIEEENLVRAKKEHESIKHVGRELKEKELPERQSRENSEKPRQRPTVRKLFSNTVLLFWGVFVFGAIALIWKPFFQIIVPPTVEKTPQIVTTSTYTETVEVHTTSTVEPTITPTSLPTEIMDAKGVSMALVSAGKFTMGYPASEAYRFCQTFQSHLIWYGNPCKEEDYLHEEPLHDVSLKDYYIDVYEVSNSDYKECVDARTCVPPISSSANRHSKYWDNEFYVDYPVVYVTWEMAKTYCEWRGARLPTEAEWEKAARGVNAFTYPWGKFTPDYRVYAADFYTNRASLNLNEPEKPTTPVTSNPSGLSQYGAYNMAGNVAEWVSDWYNETYYSRSPSEYPSGPSAGDQKVVRGGSVNSFDVRTTVRDYLWPTEAQPYIGIRCAKDAP
jgi:formylglycine-generating enzyme required for sulfatase activity